MCNSTNVDNRNRDLYYQTIRSPHIRECFARLRLDRGNNYNAETEKKCDECDVPLNSTHYLLSVRNLCLKEGILLIK